jgi:hypothetical protein
LAQSQRKTIAQSSPEKQRGCKYSAYRTGANGGKRRDELREKQANQKQQRIFECVKALVQDAIGNHVAVSPNLRELERDQPHNQATQREANVDWNAQSLECLLSGLKQFQK